MKKSSKLKKVSAAMFHRFTECGLNPEEIMNLPDQALGNIALGNWAFIVVRGHAKCACCGKQKMTMFFRKASKVPLEKLLT